MESINRRDVLRGGAAIATAGGVGLSVPAHAGQDAALLNAERELVALHTALDDQPGGGSAADWQRFDALEVLIATTPAQTLVGVAVKLRRLADPAQGIDAIDADYHLTGLAQALAVVEREAAKGDVS